MAVRRCSLCGLNYPQAYGGLCLKCDGKLDFIYNASQEMSEEEFNELRKVNRLRKGDDPETLNAAEQKALDDDLDGFLALYADLEAEARRRGPRWTVSDIFEERQGRAA